MYIPDLAPMPNGIDDSTRRLLAVGWLDLAYEYNQGSTSLEFQSILESLCTRPVCMTRVFQICQHCKSDSTRYNGEIQVLGTAGRIYVSPSLISHYVTVHGYLPPQVFIDAVLAHVPNIYVDASQLTSRIFDLADQPTETNKIAFYEAFARGSVGIRLPSNMESIPAGKYIINANRNVSIPKAELPNGSQMLLVLADIARLSELEAAATFMEIGVADVIKIAKQNHCGIIVQASFNGRNAWGGIPADDLERILNIANVNRLFA